MTEIVLLCIRSAQRTPLEIATILGATWDYRDRTRYLKVGIAYTYSGQPSPGPFRASEYGNADFVRLTRAYLVVLRMVLRDVVVERRRLPWYLLSSGLNHAAPNRK